MRKPRETTATGACGIGAQRGRRVGGERRQQHGGGGGGRREHEPLRFEREAAVEVDLPAVPECPPGQRRDRLGAPDDAARAERRRERRGQLADALGK